jgi:hypothetical protein
MPITRAYASAAQPGNAFLAGKNKIINGDFAINQRGFTTTSTNSIYTYDRFFTVIGGDGTATFSAQTFSPGTAPVAGYEAANFMRIVTTGQTNSAVDTRLQQRIESVRTFAGQTVTVSLWAKANSGTPSLTAEFTQSFGSGGSPSSSVTSILSATPKTAITTSWARYFWTINVPSISGKTLGTTANTDYLALNIFVSAGSSLDSRSGTLGIQNNTFDIWGIQVEAGSVATPFQTATGTLQGELAACQRYYTRFTGSTYAQFGSGWIANSTLAVAYLLLPVQMRTAPSSMDFSASIDFIDVQSTTLAATSLSLQSGETSANVAKYNMTISGGTQYRTGIVRASNSATSYVGFSAEL